MANYVSAMISRVYVVRWTGLGTIQDLREQLDEMQRGAARLRQKLIYISIVPTGTPSLPAEARSELIRRVPEVLEHCDAVYNVIEGTGFWAGTMRSMLAGLMLASKLTRGKAYVCQSLEEALSKIGNDVDMDRESFLRRARMEGVAA